MEVYTNMESECIVSAWGGLVNIVALFISVFALLFIIFSFWWMNWRRGKIIVGLPRSFAATSKSEDDLLIVQLPLVFYNDGAASQVIQNLRLTLVQNGNRSAILYFNNTVHDLVNVQNREWARQFAVEGRKSYSSVFVFQRKPGNFIFHKGKCQAILEGKINNDKNWKAILTFDLQISAKSIKTINSGQLIPYDNDPDRERENE